MRFLQKRLSKTIAFILYKLKLVSNMGIALQIINQGKLKINNKSSYT
jgi:ribosomal protein S4